MYVRRISFRRMQNKKGKSRKTQVCLTKQIKLPIHDRIKGPDLLGAIELGRLSKNYLLNWNISKGRSCLEEQNVLPFSGETIALCRQCLPLHRREKKANFLQLIATSSTFLHPYCSGINLFFVFFSSCALIETAAEEHPASVYEK